MPYNWPKTPRNSKRPSDDSCRHAVSQCPYPIENRCTTEGRSRDSIAHLVQIHPGSADVERDGQALTVNPDEVAVGETIVVRSG